MDSKIIKMNVNLETLKPGGGTPILKVPNNIDNLLKIYENFKNMEPFISFQIFVLNHKIFIDREGQESTIPAPSNRFIEALTMIFGDNNFVPLQTRYNHTNKRLDFLYYVNYNEIKQAENRLEKIIEIIKVLKKKSKIEKIDNLFNYMINEGKKITQNLISDYAKENEFKIFSYTKFLKIISGQQHLYEKFEMVIERVSSTRDDETEIQFVSTESRKNAELIFQENRVNVLYHSDLNLTINGFFEGKIPGVIYSKKSKPKKVTIDKPKTKNLQKALYEYFSLKDEEKSNINVGVIDGGIPENSIVKKDLTKYIISKDIGIDESLPKGNHAENVCSLLLWANKLSIKTKDNLKSPQVYLFDVISEKDTIASFKQKVQKIISENGHNIKIWNISLSFPGEKQSEVLSQVGVFLDRLQVKHKVLIFVATGNIDQKDKLKIINSPSGSFMAVSVSSVKKNNQPTSYTKTGHGMFLNQKPDFAIFGGDDDDKIRIISNSMVSESSGGTSFANPLAVRKAVALLDLKFDILEIPAILNTYATWYSLKNDININDKNGNGVIPVDSNEMLNLINDNAMVVFNKELSPDYYQGYLNLKIPKFENKYDVEIVSSINVNGQLTNYSTYEYVLDSSTFTLGRVDPFKGKIQNEMHPNMENGVRDGKSEQSLRVYRGKLKTRNTKISIPVRARASKKFSTKFQKEENIDNWGIKFTRNLIGKTRNKVGSQKIAVCIIFSSKNQNFFQEYINLNKNIIKNYNELTNIQENIIEEILFY